MTNPSNKDFRRLVFNFDDGVFSFRRFSENANYVQLLDLAEAINSFQDEQAKNILLVSVRHF